MTKIVSLLVLSILFGLIYFLFNPEFPDVIYVSIGALLILLIREFLFSFLDKNK
ncbi:hypothetical protein [Bacillus weihaiensis]|uniref:hypothetical protein n=1 Tax=Bacillus weihaiensis TaxID=1547283 RepID=UPI00235480D6|nr:hypothetical protein [Bacillus weihaiensis]